MEVQIYNTLSRSKEVFKPLIPNTVGMYVCGPTVYGNAHLGHAKSYVSFDVVLRYFRYLGYRVRYVQNITDVGHLTDDADAGEDKLAKQARLERKEPMEIAEHYTYTYFRDMDALNVLRPDISPRASGHIPEQIAMIEALIRKGNAYEVDGNVYFDVTTDPDYGKLSGRKLDDTMAGTRVQTAEGKRNPEDFALWKKADTSHIMKWPSPWGVGYPGWHIECSAMAIKYLGETIDIHGGGLENQFPHHECEIAQSEHACGKEFVRYWMHNNMVTLNGQKMGKSLGNAISLEQFFSGNHPLLTRKWSPEVIRFFLLQSHYRSTTDFSEAALQAAENGMNNLNDILKVISSATNGAGEAVALAPLQEAVHAAMNDDFNSAMAIASLFEHLRPVRAALLQGNNPSNIESLAAFLRRFVDDVLGIWPKAVSGGETVEVAMHGMMELILSIRAQARKDKNWPLADQIRNHLNALNVVVEDGKEGSTWTLKSS